MIESRFVCPRCKKTSPWTTTDGPHKVEGHAAAMVGGQLHFDRQLIYEVCSSCFVAILTFTKTAAYDRVLPRVALAASERPFARTNVPDNPLARTPNKKRSPKKTHARSKR